MNRACIILLALFCSTCTPDRTLPSDVARLLNKNSKTPDIALIVNMQQCGYCTKKLLKYTQENQGNPKIHTIVTNVQGLKSLRFEIGELCYSPTLSIDTFNILYKKGAIQSKAIFFDQSSGLKNNEILISPKNIQEILELISEEIAIDE